MTSGRSSNPSSPPRAARWRRTDRHRFGRPTLGNSFDILRTKVLLTMRKNGWKRLAVTSPTMGCGKTTTACNLAIGRPQPPICAPSSSSSTCAGPHRQTLGIEVEPDVSERMLSGKVDFAEQALRYRVKRRHRSRPNLVEGPHDDPDFQARSPTTLLPISKLSTNPT
jgi:hypothetical protein